MEVEIREITFQQYRENLAKQGFPIGYKYPWTQRYCYTFDNSLLFTESIQNIHKSFHAKS